MGVAEQARLPPAEAVVADRYGDGDVDADHADLDVELELPCGASVTSEDRRAVGVRACVDRVETVLVAGDTLDAQHRTEDLVVVAGHAGLHVVEQRRVDEVAIRWHTLAAVDDDGCPAVGGTVDVALHLVAVLARDERAHLAVVVVSGADLDRRDPLGDLRHQFVGDLVGGENHADRHATLPR